MRRIAAGVLAAAVGASVLLTAGPALAHPRTDLKVDLTRIHPDPVQVKRGEATRVTFDVVSKDAVRVELSLKPVGPRFHRFPEKQAQPFGRGDFKRFYATFTAKDPAGKWLATAVAFDRSGKKVLDRETFAVELVKTKFDTRIVRFGAYPKKVRKGKPVFFRGYLLSTEHRRPKGYAWQEVDILYRSSPHGRWRKLDETRTDRSGRFNAAVRAFKSGQYKAVFEGNRDANGSESEVVSVRVKGGYHHFHW
jgi:hypothetical protein